jgi:hypothetical protein
MNLDRIERCRVVGHTKAQLFTLISPCIAFKQRYRKERILFKMKHWRQKKMAVVKMAFSGNNSFQKSDNGSLKKKIFLYFMLKLARGSFVSG